MEQRDVEIAENIVKYLENSPGRTRTNTEIFNACGGAETIEALRMLEQQGKVTRPTLTEYRLS